MAPAARRFPVPGGGQRAGSSSQWGPPSSRGGCCPSPGRGRVCGLAMGAAPAGRSDPGRFFSPHGTAAGPGAVFLPSRHRRWPRPATPSNRAEPRRGGEPEPAAVASGAILCPPRRQSHRSTSGSPPLRDAACPGAAPRTERAGPSTPRVGTGNGRGVPSVPSPPPLRMERARRRAEATRPGSPIGGGGGGGRGARRGAAAGPGLAGSVSRRTRGPVRRVWGL